MKKRKAKKARIKGKGPRGNGGGARVKGEGNWTVNEFVDNVWKTMEDQAERNKALKMVHAKLEPEWNKVVQTVSQMLEATGEPEVTRYTEEICRYGEHAVRPLIDIILRLKSAVNLMDKSRDQGNTEK